MSTSLFSPPTCSVSLIFAAITEPELARYIRPHTPPNENHHSFPHSQQFFTHLPNETQYGRASQGIF
ncbi:MAG: hypothetical protein MUF71_11545 [Candidatus Kapabacteria bacterium]|nr:hypothetical protein [Candidatus Kapabacteria bacterium]